MEQTETWQSLLMSVITAVLAENFVFVRAFGVSTMIMAAKNKRTLPGMILGVCYFSVLSSAAAWAASNYLPDVEQPFIPLLYALMIGAQYAVTLVASRIILPSKFAKMKKYVHISAFNSVVMGTIFLSSVGCETLWEYLMFGICSGLGFSAAAVMLSGVYPVLYSEDAPAAFRGYPAVMIFTGIVAMAVYGILGRIPAYGG